MRAYEVMGKDLKISSHLNRSSVCLNTEKIHTLNANCAGGFAIQVVFFSNTPQYRWARLANFLWRTGRQLS